MRVLTGIGTLKLIEYKTTVYIALDIRAIIISLPREYHHQSLPQENAMHITPELEAELNAEQTEKAVDKVLDGIDAAKVREQLLEAMNRVVTAQDSAIDCTEIEGIADELLKQFIIMPRS